MSAEVSTTGHGICCGASKTLLRRSKTSCAALPSVTKCSPVGSLRRKQDTVGDLNFLVAGKNAAAIFRGFSRFGAVQSSQARGKTEQLFKLSSGITVFLKWSAQKEWGLSLIQATGSGAHLSEVAAHARAKGMIFTARGLARKRVDLSKEEAIYASLGLDFIEPELREGRGEVSAAAHRKLPKLVTLQDLRGDLHMHTTASDGTHAIPEMVAAARQKGYEYISITDHSQSLKITNGLTEKRLRAQIRAIDALNAKLTGFQILKSSEVDILEDGRLDFPDTLLKELDLTICSIHSRFSLNKQQQTERILRAMDNPHFNILGHATGRLLLRREGYELDMERIIEHAQANGCFFEINANPNRLDLSEQHARLAKDAGVRIAVNTDGHSIEELDFMAAGINQARRAWLQPTDVLNTYPLKKLRQLLKR